MKRHELVPGKGNRHEPINFMFVAIVWSEVFPSPFRGRHEVIGVISNVLTQGGEQCRNLRHDDHFGGEYSSTVEVKINVGEEQHALDLPWPRNSISELYFPHRLPLGGAEGCPSALMPARFCKADGHLAYADAKVFYQGVPLVVRGRLRVLIDIAN